MGARALLDVVRLEMHSRVSRAAGRDLYFVELEAGIVLQLGHTGVARVGEHSPGGGRLC